MDEKIYVTKKNGTKQDWSDEKIIRAVEKSANRATVELTEAQYERIINGVKDRILILGVSNISVSKIHNFVEQSLDEVSPKTADSYRAYRNFKNEYANMMDIVANKAQTIMYRGDRENANKDSALVSTQGSLIRSAVMEEMYKHQFLTEEELRAQNEGFIYIHDKDARLLSANCCLFRMDKVLEGGFEMGNIWYNEPNSLDTAFDVISDVVLSAASQQYGGFTIPRVDTLLVKYANKSYKKIYAAKLSEYKILTADLDAAKELAQKMAMAEIERIFEQGFQGWEYKFNTVASSRGDYPFITVTSGLDRTEFGIMANKVMFKVHSEGQGAKGKKRPVLFPKYVFLYDKNIHQPGEEVYEAALACSRKTMYPDWLSLTGEGYVPSMYKKYGAVISPMGCRAFLSPYYERGGFEPADENDTPVYEGRFNAGAISFNLPLIYIDAKANGKDFFESLNYYMQMIRKIHIRTRDFLAEKKASINPLGFCMGGFYGGNLDFNQKLKENPKVLEATTFSFGITALNELQQAYNGKSITEDGEFALEVIAHINRKANEYKQEDHMLYALYGTPAENLCGKQITQLRDYVKLNVDKLEAAGYKVTKNEDGDFVIKNVCSRPYVTNSFHCPVWEDISPIEKQNKENRFWNLMNGGKIQYVRYPIAYNKKAQETLINRAMDMGFYEGVNLALNYCDDCGHEEIDMADICPCCGSKNITKIDRMNGYLAFSRVKGDSRLNKAKMAEIAERKSM